MLTNGDSRHFTDANRVKVDLESLTFGVLDDLLCHGEEYQGHIDRMRASKKVHSQHDGISKKKMRFARSGPVVTAGQTLLAAERMGVVGALGGLFPCQRGGFCAQTFDAMFQKLSASLLKCLEQKVMWHSHVFGCVVWNMFGHGLIYYT